MIISLGGGVVDWPASLSALSKKYSDRSIRKLYIEKNFNDLQVILNDKRPFIPNFEQVCQTRSTKY